MMERSKVVAMGMKKMGRKYVERFLVTGCAGQVGRRGQGRLPDFWHNLALMIFYQENGKAHGCVCGFPDFSGSGSEAGLGKGMEKGDIGSFLGHVEVEMPGTRKRC